MKTLYLTVKKEWFDKIASGEKTIEYREYKKYWQDRFCNILGLGFDTVIFKNGYRKDSPQIIATLNKIVKLKNGLETDLKIDKPVYAIHFKILEVKR